MKLYKMLLFCKKYNYIRQKIIILSNILYSLGNGKKTWNLKSAHLFELEEVKPEDLDRLYHLKQENKRNQIKFVRQRLCTGSTQRSKRGSNQREGGIRSFDDLTESTIKDFETGVSRAIPFISLVHGKLRGLSVDSLRED